MFKLALRTDRIIMHFLYNLLVTQIGLVYHGVVNFLFENYDISNQSLGLACCLLILSTVNFTFLKKN